MSEVATNVAGSGEVDTYATPIFKTKRFAKLKEFVVPNQAYRQMRPGRSPGDKWAGFIEDEGLRKEVRDAWHKEGGCIVTCDLTGAAIMLKKKHRKANDNVDSSLGG